jgi:DNA-binding transcriptional regulator YiaG
VVFGIDLLYCPNQVLINDNRSNGLRQPLSVLYERNSLNGDTPMLTAEQSRAARGLLDWSQNDLAEASNLGHSTIRNFEAGRRVPGINNLVAIRRALEQAGVVIIDEGDASEGGGAGVRLAKPSGERS